MADLLFGPVPHQDATDFIRSKPPVSRAVFDGLLPELRARAFCVTGIENVNVLQRLRDKIAELPEGVDWDDVKADIVDDISPYLVDDDAEPEERDKQIVAANRRAELLLRTHGFQAYQSAAYDLADRQRDTHPYWQYMTMEDAQVRPSHAALDGVILPADSSFWRDHYPPWDWGCRCQVVPISQDDYEDAQKADAKLPVDDRMILDDARQRELEQNGRLVRGPNQITNCKSPVAMGKEHAFQWHPGDLRLPLDQLRARYSPETWNTFESWAKATVIDEHDPDRSVWAWLNGPPPAQPPASPPPASKKTLAAALQHLGLNAAGAQQATVADMQALAKTLAEDHPVDCSAFVADTQNQQTAGAAGALDPAQVETWLNEFLRNVPPQLANAAPIKVRLYDAGAHPSGAHYLASYDKRGQVLALCAGSSKEDVFHELGHWLDGHCPDPAKTAAVYAHYAARVAPGQLGSDLKPLYPSQPPEPQFWTRPDDWWKRYAGMEEYRPGGSAALVKYVPGAEIMSNYAEWLALPPDAQARVWNNPKWRETLTLVLDHFFV